MFIVLSDFKRLQTYLSYTHTTNMGTLSVNPWLMGSRVQERLCTQTDMVTIDNALNALLKNVVQYGCPVL